MLVKCSSQRVTDSDKAEEMITTGWRFVGVLPNGRIVLKKQSDQSISGDQGKQAQKTYPT